MLTNSNQSTNDSINSKISEVKSVVEKIGNNDQAANVIMEAGKMIKDSIEELFKKIDEEGNKDGKPSWKEAKNYAKKYPSELKQAVWLYITMLSTIISVIKPFFAQTLDPMEVMVSLSFGSGNLILFGYIKKNLGLIIQDKDKKLLAKDETIEATKTALMESTRENANKDAKIELLEDRVEFYKSQIEVKNVSP